MKKITCLACLSAVILTGCGSQQEAETKLVRGCEAAVKVMLNKEDYDRQLAAVTGQKFGMSDGFRLVTIDATTKNKEFGFENEESFQCKFEESRSFGYLNWKAALVQVKIDDAVFGSEGGQLYGSVEDQMALTAAVEAAMR